MAEWRRRVSEGQAAGPCTQTCSVRAEKKEHAVAVVRSLRRPPRTLGAQEWALEIACQVQRGVAVTSRTRASVLVPSTPQLSGVRTWATRR